MKNDLTKLFENLGSQGLFTAEQVAEVLGVSVKTIRKWRYQGKLKAVKVGERCVRYRREDVLDQLNQEGVDIGQ